MSGPLRVGVVGATGALGTELLAVLGESELDVAEVVPVATDASLGSEVEFRGSAFPVETELSSYRGLDCLILCAPEEAAPEYVREALRNEVPCIDAGGAMAGVDEAPLHVAAFGAAEPSPLLVVPPGAALALALALRPLAEAAGLRRVVATCLEAASWGGRRGIESLYEETVALFNQDEAPEPGVFGQAVAFDCIPALGEVDDTGASERERLIEGVLGRLVARSARYALQFVQVPTFTGFGVTAAVELERPLGPDAADAVLAKASGVERWNGFADGATLRATTGRDAVLASRVRSDPSLPETGLLVWLAADLLRLSAAQAVQLAARQVARLH